MTTARLEAFSDGMFGQGVYLTAIVVSLVAPVVALALHGAMAVYYAFDQATVPAGA